MKRSSSTYVVQLYENGKAISIAHSEIKGVLHCEFISRKSAIELMNKEKAIAPENKFRIIKKTISIEEGKWN